MRGLLTFALAIVAGLGWAAALRERDRNEQLKAATAKAAREIRHDARSSLFVGDDD